MCTLYRGGSHVQFSKYILEQKMHLHITQHPNHNTILYYNPLSKTLKNGDPALCVGLVGQSTVQRRTGETDAAVSHTTAAAGLTHNDALGYYIIRTRINS